MNILFFTSMLAGLVTLSAYFPYIRAILKKETRPSFISWPIWALSLSLIFATSYSVGARLTLVLIFAGIIGNIIISILAWRYGEKTWTKLDIASIVVSIASLVVWFITNNALIALIMIVAIDTAGYFPTIQNILKNPRSENRTAWMLFGIGALFNMVTLLIAGDFKFGVVLFPLVYFFTVGITNIVLLLKR